MDPCETNTKAKTLFGDHQHQKNGLPWPKRPLSRIASLVIPALTSICSATDTPTAAHERNTQKFPLENPTENPSKNQEKKAPEYQALLEEYRKNPPTLKALLTHVWEDLGLPPTEAAALLQNSFQNKNLIPVDLNKRATLIYAEKDILEADTLPGLKNFFQCGVHAEILETTIKILNAEHGSQIPTPPTENPTPEDLQKTWQQIETLTNHTPAALKTLAFVKTLANKMVENMLTKAAGWAAPGDHTYIVSQTQAPKTLFQFIASHEATHTAQATHIPPSLNKPLKTLREGLIQTFTQTLNEKTQTTQLTLHAKEATRRTETFAEEMGYLTNPIEIATWAGMIKKIYFEQTGELLQRSSTPKELDQFHTWLKTTPTETNEYKKNIIKTFQIMSDILRATPETEKILMDHLKDVAKKKTNPKNKMENPNTQTLC